MSALIALASVALYTAQQPVEHNGTLYPVGSPIELDAAAAQPLLDVRAIAHSDDNAAALLQAEQEPGRMAALEQALDRKESELQSWCTEGAALQARVEELSKALAEQAEAHQAELQALRGEADAAGTKAAAAASEAAELRVQLETAKTAESELQGLLGKAQADLAAAAAKSAKAK